jgi:hypothetical protein
MGRRKALPRIIALKIVLTLEVEGVEDVLVAGVSILSRQGAGEAMVIVLLYSSSNIREYSLALADFWP